MDDKDGAGMVVDKLKIDPGFILINITGHHDPPFNVTRDRSVQEIV